MPELPEWVRSLPQATLAGASGIKIVALTAERLVCISRCTLAVIELREASGAR